MGVEHYALGANPLPGHRPMIAIPTTAGTGAEVTRTCIVTDRDGRKVWTWGDELLPDLVVLDPASTVTMPPTSPPPPASTRSSTRSRPSAGGARTALVAAPALHAPPARRSTTSRPPSPTPDDLEARQAMQEAALLAGLAIDGGGTGIAHSIGHALGTLAPRAARRRGGDRAGCRARLERRRRRRTCTRPRRSRSAVPVAELPDLLRELLDAVGLPGAIASASRARASSPTSSPRR